jgi:4-nitrophenyl phosphatase
VDVLAALRKLGKKLIFVSNNSTSSRSDYLKKFQVLGIEAHVDEIFGSSYAAAVYLSKVIKLPKDKQVFIIGMKGMQDELDEEGVAWVGGQVPFIILLEIKMNIE